MPTLSIRTGPQRGAEFDFDEPIVIGRGGTVDLVLADTSVSRSHARVVPDQSQWCIEDLGSANGTFLNDRRLTQRAPISNGDTLRVGSVLLTYENAARPRSVRSAAQARRIALAYSATDHGATLTPTADSPPASSLESGACADADQRVILRVTAEAAAAAVAARGSLTPWTRQSRVIDGLAGISSMVFDKRALLSFVVDELFEAFGQAERAFVMLWDQEFDRLVPMAGRMRSGEPCRPMPANQRWLRDVLASKEAVLIASLSSRREWGAAESSSILDLRSIICAPILFQNDMVGVMQVDGSPGGPPFDRSDVALTMVLASDIGTALSYARLHARLLEREVAERDIGLTRKIQQHFLPPAIPTVPGYRLAVHYRPALAVGGDLYAFVELGGGQMAIVVGDVSGKGISAALFAAKVASELRYQAAGQTRPAAILHRLNQALTKSDHEGMFVTVLLVVLDSSTGRLSVASSGHPLPFVRDSKGVVVAIGGANDQPLGRDRRAEFTQYDYEIESGDAILLYTDGVTRALDPDAQQYGEQRLIDTIAAAPAASDEIVRAVAADVRTFALGRPQDDDVTVVCVERAGT